MAARILASYSTGLLSALALAVLSCKGAPPEPSASASAPIPSTTATTTATAATASATSVKPVAQAPSATATAAPVVEAPRGPEITPEERKKIPGRLSFISERDNNREVYVIDADGSSERRITKDPAADYNGPGSPDGKAILLIRAQEHEGPQRLYLQPLDGSAAKPLSPSAGRVRFPSFAPDGKWVVFESDGENKDQKAYSDIYRVGVDGKGTKRLTENPEGNFEPAIAPRGDAIVLLSSRDRRAELYRILPDGSDPKRLTNTPRDEWGARFSGSGDEIVYVSDQGGADRVYIMPSSGGPARRVSSRDRTTQVVEDHPAWCPTERKIVYELRAPGAPTRLVLADVSAGTELLVPLADGGGEMTSAVWSPDGRYVALTVTKGDDSQVYLVRADGSGLVRITTAKGPNWNPQWIPLRAR